MKTAVPCVLLLSINLFAGGCSQPQAVSSTMSDEDKTTLRASLAKLEDTLRDKSPFIIAKLAPAATDEQLSNLRAELGGAQVDCLEIWFGWHDGCEGRITDLLPPGRLLCISEALDDRKKIQDIPFVDATRKNALKIMDDGAGDGFFLDIASTTPRVFYHMLEDPYPRDYGTLQDFVAFITEVHAAGLAKEDENGMVDFDLPGYEKLKVEYLQRITTP